MADIFISYARADKQFVRRLYSELQRFKVRGFMDETDLAAGADLSRKLRETVEHADAVVVVLSEEAAKSRWVMAEIGLAQSFNKAVIPVLAPRASYDLSVPEQLVDTIVIDANNQSLEVTAAKIVAAVTSMSVESALAEVQTRFRRRQRILTGATVSLASLLVVSVAMANLAFKQRSIARREAASAERAYFDAQKARAIAEQQRNRVVELTGQSAALAVSPDGRTIATGDKDGSVGLWDFNTGKAISSLKGHQGTVSGLAFSPDGKLLATASWDGTVAIWDIPAGRVLSRLIGHTNAVIGVGFSPDGTTVLSRSLDGAVNVWRIDGTLIRTIEVPE
jgi:hypothetical protein